MIVLSVVGGTSVQHLWSVDRDARSRVRVPSRHIIISLIYLLLQAGRLEHGGRRSAWPAVPSRHVPASAAQRHRLRSVRADQLHGRDDSVRRGTGRRRCQLCVSAARLAAFDTLPKRQRADRPQSTTRRRAPAQRRSVNTVSLLSRSEARFTKYLTIYHRIILSLSQDPLKIVT